MKRKAKWAKWLGLGSLIGLFTPFCILSLPAAIVAIIISHQVPKESVYYKDATTGKITGWITIGFLAALAFVLTTILIRWGPK